MNKYQEALDYFDESDYIVDFEYPDHIRVRDIDEFRNNVNTLQELIDQSDNPPLKFKDIRNNTWIYDNSVEEYICVVEVSKHKGNGFIAKQYRCGQEIIYPFRENRFYRREVVE